MVAINVEADLAEIRKPMDSAPFTAKQIEQLFTNSTLLRSKGVIFEAACDCASRSAGSGRTWQLTIEGKKYTVTFFPEVFETKSSVRFMNFGEPLFKQLLNVSNS